MPTAFIIPDQVASSMMLDDDSVTSNWSDMSWTWFETHSLPHNSKIWVRNKVTGRLDSVPVCNIKVEDNNY